MVGDNLLLSEANEKILSKLDNTIGLGELKEKIREMIRYHEVMKKYKCNIEFENYNIILRKRSSYNSYKDLLQVISEIFYENKITLNSDILKINIDDIRNEKFNEKKYRAIKEDIIFIDITEGYRNVEEIREKIIEMVEAMPLKVFIIMENNFREGETNALFVDYFSWAMNIEEISNEEKKRYIKSFFEKNKLICSNQTLKEIADDPYYKIKIKLNNILVSCKIAKTKNVENVLKENNEKQKKKTKTNKSGMQELEELTGLEDVKTQIKKIVNYIKVCKEKNKINEKNKIPMLHMCFNGNPGTGKTTVARIVGKIFAEEKIFSNDKKEKKEKKNKRFSFDFDDDCDEIVENSYNFVEAQRSDLIGKYVGHTAPKTKAVMERASGGVLFIDEAYSIATYIQDEGGRDYGAECIATLLKGMEDNRDNLCVILAGYTKEMEQMLSANPGFESRIQFKVNFPDYTAEELYTIFKNLCKEEGYKVSSNLKQTMLVHFENARKNKNFANARYVRSLFEKVKMEQADRVMVQEDNIEMIKRVDVEKAIMQMSAKEEKKKTKNKIGFVA